MINVYQTLKRTKQLGLVTVIAVLFLISSLVLLQFGAYARWHSSGAGGCGDFATAVDLALDGDTGSPDGARQGFEWEGHYKEYSDSWRLAGNQPDGCNGQQTYTDTTDMNAASFEFQGTLTRSLLFHSGAPVITIDPQVLTLTVQHIIFEGNSTPKGAGISGVISNGAKIRLDNIVIDNSSATDAGGGLHLEVRGNSRLVIDGQPVY